MRRLLSALTVLLATLGVVAVPVVARPTAMAHAVAPQVQTLDIRTRLATTTTHRFDLVGATWRRGSLDSGAARLEVRVHRDGSWSGWQSLGAADGGADGGTLDARRAANVHDGTVTAEPLWVGESDGVQARVVGAGRVPAQLHVLLVDGGTSGADAHPQPVRVWGGSVADAAVDEPTIYTRADWGADESIRKRACPSGPTYSPTVEMGFIHHTDGGNGYSRSQVPSIIRSIYAYHVQANGWCDIGYNYLVDRFGRIWEGRAGGITRAVIGAHTGGFNYDSFGAALIGTFTSSAPSSAMLSAVEQLFAWRLGTYYRDPLGHATLTAASFSGSRFRSGSDVRFDTVSGHRDADLTTCPGNTAYADLPGIRTAIRDAMGAGFVNPKVSTTTVRMADGAVDVSAGAIGKQSWTLTVTDAAGIVVQTVTGTASRATDVAAAWDLDDADGLPVQPGDYTLTLTGTAADGSPALPWSTQVAVTPPVTLTVPAQTGLNQPVTAAGHGVPGHTVSLSVTGPAGVQQLGSFSVSPAGRWTASTAPVTAAGDLTWAVTDPAVANYQRTRTTRVGPIITDPAGTQTFVAAGQPLAVHGTALPGNGATVQLVTQPVSAGAPITGPTLSVGSDGTWATTVTPTEPTDMWAVDARGLASGRSRVYPVHPATAAAPRAGYAGRQVTVHGDAGHAPVRVTLLARQPGSDWTTIRTGTAGPNGHFAARLPLADAPGQSTEWKVRTGYGAPATGTVALQPVFAPTVAGPAKTAWRVRHTLAGTAVPGDVVTVWTAPAGTAATSTRWTRRGTVTAAADDSWSFPLRFTRDTAWRVTSPSGTSSSGTTVVVPTISAPARVVTGAPVVIHGTAVPGQQVTLSRRTDGATAWVSAGSVTAGPDGVWSIRRRARHSASYQAASGGHTSRVVSVAVD